jgi:hypothetical protein
MFASVGQFDQILLSNADGLSYPCCGVHTFDYVAARGFWNRFAEPSQIHVKTTSENRGYNIKYHYMGPARYVNLLPISLQRIQEI